MTDEHLHDKRQAHESDELDDLSVVAATPDEHGHVPVLPAEVVALLSPKPGQIMLDCTLGRGGHAELLLPMLGETGRYIGLDVDPLNIEHARQRLTKVAQPAARFDLAHANFATAGSVLSELQIQGPGAGPRVDLLLADLGFASNQVADPMRGFSFANDGPLDMRLDPSLPQTAADLVNRLPEHELANVIYRYGEERLSRKIARKITEARSKTPIQSTAELARLVREAFGVKDRAPGPWRPGRIRIDPATRTFMALRIAVNAELDALERLLDLLPKLLNPGAVAAIISFHSLEDRLVKHAFADLAKAGLARRLTPKPVIAGEAERDRNPRSRSAKLRAVEWIGTRSVEQLP